MSEGDSSPISDLRPLTSAPISIRVATMADLPFMDALQKQHSKQLGYFPTKQFEGYIEQQCVLIAEEATERRSDGATKGDELGLPSVASSLRGSTPLGYCISKDRYLKRDELGVIYQLCVVPGEQRKLVGASLIKEVFARSAYGCRLYCCWCAQDIAANHFWESLGFLPVAFRAGSSGKKRVHIFWQRRINADDQSTPYWYPSQTNSGAIREDRLVFRIPPGTHWTEVKAVALPSEQPAEPKQLPAAKLKSAKEKTPERAGVMRLRGFRFQTDAPEKVEKPKREKAPKAPSTKLRAGKIDPKFVRAARELRDRYLEQVNERTILLSQSKYDVSRMLSTVEASRALPREGAASLLLPEAA